MNSNFLPTLIVSHSISIYVKRIGWVWCSHTQVSLTFRLLSIIILPLATIESLTRRSPSISNSFVGFDVPMPTRLALWIHIIGFARLVPRCHIQVHLLHSRNEASFFLTVVNKADHSSCFQLNCRCITPCRVGFIQFYHVQSCLPL